ncbi:unnamed protein product [Allacma fusca]|uniref:Uncharacterized protein n=1 Tax=Allacma fusca TaxID=39272 RepID=A0A8J2KQH0_9HEXA|nr:unnamed protein product [Allacma fusca]
MEKVQIYELIRNDHVPITRCFDHKFREYLKNLLKTNAISVWSSKEMDPLIVTEWCGLNQLPNFMKTMLQHILIVSIY